MARSKTVFCPNCQVEVEAVNSLGPGGSTVPRCTICGTIIKDTDEASDIDTQSVSLDQLAFEDDSISIPAMSEIMVVGYPPGVRQVIIDKISQKNLAKTSIACQNGEEMIIEVIKSLSGQSGNGDIDLIVIDVPMPFINGINAAIGLRAIERTYTEHDLIPILFLTNKPCDDTFKKSIRYLAPAKYATLGPIDEKQNLVKHLERILGLVAKEKW